MLCTDRSFVNANSVDGELRGLRCKRWSCPTCQPYNRLKVMHAAKRGRPNIFMTLTCKPALHESPAHAARGMVRGLVLLRRRLARMGYGDKMPFIVVFESHESGWPHMHLLVRSQFIPWQKLRAIWEEISGAYKVDIRTIKRASQVLFYVTKYIGKDLHKFDGCKRWWRSHNYNVIEEEKPAITRLGPTFCRIDHEYDSLVSKLRLLGWELQKTGPFAVYMRPDFGRCKERLDAAILAVRWWTP